MIYKLFATGTKVLFFFLVYSQKAQLNHVMCVCGGNGFNRGNDEIETIFFLLYSICEYFMEFLNNCHFSDNI